MRQATVLGLLALLVVGFPMLTTRTWQDASPPTLLGRALHLDALGAPKPDAPLVRRTAPGVDVRINPDGFEVAGPKTVVSLSGLGTGRGNWARFARGVARPTVFGHETVVVTPEKAEQFLTVERRQGLKTWRWRLAAGDSSQSLAMTAPLGCGPDTRLPASTSIRWPFWTRLATTSRPTAFGGR